MPKYWLVTAVADGRATVLPDTMPMERLIVVGIAVGVAGVFVTVTICVVARAQVQDGGEFGEPH